MKRNLITLLLILLLPQLTFSQKIKVTRIIDTNLFELEDGKFIKMAGLDVPNKDYPGENMSSLAESIIEYAESNLLKHSLEVIPVSEQQTDSSFRLVYLYELYPFKKVDINEKYLELGYGKFYDNIDSLHREKYLKAAYEAISNKRHLWSFRLPEINDTLDNAFTSGTRLYDNRSDSLYYIEFLRKRGTPLDGQILEQIFFGAGIGAAGAWLTSMAAVGISFKDGYDIILPGLIGLSFGYLTGTSYGVYLAAKQNNPALSYLNTLAFSTVCTIGTAGLAYSLDWKEPVLNWACLFVPLVSPLIYVNEIAPNPVKENINAFRFKNPKTGGLAFKDYYNQAITMKMNLFQISF